jgi:uncharacterized protein YcgI (DUF1989 family)
MASRSESAVTSVPTETRLFEELLPHGAAWSHVLKRGTALRMTDVDGDANVAAVFYNSENTAERYNMPDTLKAQHTARLTRGDVLFSDMGRVLCSVTEDSVGWHDPLSGCAYDGLLLELAKHGMSARDMAAPVNFFSKVTVDRHGNMTFVAGNSRPGMFIELRAEMNVLVALHRCQHPLDPQPLHRRGPVHVSISRVEAPADNDMCRITRPENARGFVLTERYYL